MKDGGDSARRAPDRLGPYEVIETLGRGGMGAVFRALAPDGSEVAVKSLLDEPIEGVRALRREVRMLRELRHPHIVRLLDEDVECDTPWYAMEVVEGPSLASLMSQADDGSGLTIIDTPAPTIRTPGRGEQSAAAVSGRGVAGWDQLTRTGLAWLGQVTRALGYMHGEGLVHGDLKPENIIVEGERAVLVDFGLAAQVEGRITLEGLRRAESRAYTPGYVSPERLRGERLDPRADLYALGCMIYELVTGRLPFEGSPMQMVVGHATREPERLRALVAEVPDALDALVSRLLAKRPEDRSAHILDVVSTLEAIGIATNVPGMRLPPAKPYLYPPTTTGREEELQRIADRLRDLKSGGGTTLILGGTGVGKSTLAVRAIGIAKDRGHRVVATSGERASPRPGATEPQRPFSGVRGLFDEVVDYTRSASPRLASTILGDDALFLAPFEPRLAEFCDREMPVLRDPISATCRSLCSVLARMFEGSGVLFVCDELHWFDPASRQAFRHLARRTDEEPWALFGIARTDELDVDAEVVFTEAADAILTLGDLSRHQTGLAVAGMFGMSELDDEVTRLIHDRSNGNPYYVREFMNVALQEGLIALDADGVWRGTGGRTLASALADVPHPDSAVELASRRLATLSPQELQLAQYAAVLGRDVPLYHLSGVTPFDSATVDRHLNSLRRREILEETADPSAMRFIHDHVRQALYESLSADARETIHFDVAETLAEREEDPALVAWHYEAAGELEPATRHWIEAAEVARSQHAPAPEAERLAHALRTGAELLSEERRHTLVADHVTALVAAGEFAGAVDVAERMLAGDLRGPPRARTLVQKSVAHRRQGESEAALACAIAALESTGDDVAVHLAALGAQGDALEVTGQADAALEIYHAVLAAAEEHDLPLVCAKTENDIALTHYNQCDYGPAIRRWESALARVTEVGDPGRESLIAMNMGNVFNDKGDYGDAIAWYERALEISERVADEPAVADIRANLGVALFHRAEYAEALRNYRASEDFRRRAGMRAGLGIVLLNQASILTEQGDYAESDSLLSDAIPLLVEAKWRRSEAYARSALGRLRVHQERHDSADDELRAALELAREIGERFVECCVLCDMSWLANYRGDPERALSNAKSAREVADAIGNPSANADARLAQGAALHRAGRAKDALEHLEAAYESFTEQQRPWHRVIAACEAALAVYGGGRDDAAVWLDRARTILDDLDVRSTSLPARLFAEADAIIDTT